MSANYLVPSQYADNTIAEAATPGDMTGQGFHNIIPDAGTYVESFDIDGHTNTDASNNIGFLSKAGEEPKGDFDSGVILNGELRTFESYTRIENVQIKVASAAAPGLDIRVGADNTKVENVLFGEIDGTKSGGGITVRANNCDLNKINIWTTSSGHNTIGVINAITASTTTTVRNTVINGTSHFGLNVLNGASIAAINLAVKASDTDFKITSGNYNGSSDNSTSDATAPGTDPDINVTDGEFDFVDAANGNFHINETSSLKDTGLPQASAFLTDIDLQTIGTWMRGSDYFVAPPVGGDGFEIGIEIGI